MYEEEKEEEEEQYYLCCFRNNEKESKECTPLEEEAGSESDPIRIKPSDFTNRTHAATPGDSGKKTASLNDSKIPQVTPTVVGVRRENEKKKEKELKNRALPDGIKTKSNIAFMDPEPEQSSERRLDDGRSVPNKVSPTLGEIEYLKITKKTKTDNFGISSVSFSCENSKHKKNKSGKKSEFLHEKFQKFFGSNFSDRSTVDEEGNSSELRSLILPEAVLLWQWILALKNIPMNSQKNVPREISGDNMKNIPRCDNTRLAKRFPNTFSNDCSEGSKIDGTEQSFEKEHYHHRNNYSTGMTVDIKNRDMTTRMKIENENDPLFLGCHWLDELNGIDNIYGSEIESDFNFDGLLDGKDKKQSNVESRVQDPSEKVFLLIILSLYAFPCHHNGLFFILKFLIFAGILFFLHRIYF